MNGESLWKNALVSRSTLMLASITLLLAHAEIASGNCTPFDGKVTISPDFPCDISGPGGAQYASLTDAAKFAWQEFIALNWPAKIASGSALKREMPDRTLFFGDRKNTGPLVWHTYRGKVEIYPGRGNPPGYIDSEEADYGYDSLPVYIYGSGEIAPASGSPSDKTPWINLDENSQIFLNQIFAGVASSVADGSKNQILFMAKANRKEYSYIASNGWWEKNKAPFQATMDYIKKYKMDPGPGVSEQVSFPTNTVEIKAAWRKLGENEDPSKYYTTIVRYYVESDPKSKAVKYRDEMMALIGLHIIHKTKTAPYFTYATFEHAENILDVDGNPVEDVNGRGMGDPSLPPMNPPILSYNAKGKSYQTFRGIPDGDFLKNPGKQLYYQNTPLTGIPTKGYPGLNQKLSNIIVNHRINGIPSEIQSVNRKVELDIRSYAAKNYSPGKGETPMRFYRLTNIQYRPLDKPEYGVDYSGPDAPTYYQSNSAIETDYNLQRFSGRFYAEFTSNDPHKFTITDFDKDGSKFKNVAYDGNLSNMGGCMGCHGNVQKLGSGFSFILKNGRVNAPEAANVPVTVDQVARFARYFSAPAK